MGTNYFLDAGDSAASEHCATCTCTEPVLVHICKSHRMFEGHFKDGEPWLTSWADWKTYLTVATGAGARIVDECGDQYGLGEFVADVEAVPKEDRRRQYDWVAVRYRHSRMDVIGPRGDWLDADEFSFYGGDFR